MAKVFVRGSTVFFDVVFKDQEGNVVAPGSASIVVNFPKTGQTRDKATLALAAAAGFDGGWGIAAGWDSRVAEPGIVYAHARTGGDVPISSVDFEFKLIGNAANADANS